VARWLSSYEKTQSLSCNKKEEDIVVEVVMMMIVFVVFEVAFAVGNDDGVVVVFDALGLQVCHALGLQVCQPLLTYPAQP